MPVVVVESPAKAKTINKYVGPGYTVLASYGHVRDLPPKDGSVDPEHGFAMTWEVASSSKKHVKAIADALKDDDTLILATDPDREGEAISWHLEETLRQRRAIGKDTDVRRVVFNAVTRSAVTEAMANPRTVDEALVEAYLARRALDYLVGFNLSPVLWRKLPGAKSAGRVQSVCLRLIVEREMEIENFRAQEYWTLRARFVTPRGDEYEARLTVLEGRKLGRYDIADAATAEAALQAVSSRQFSVTSVEAKPTSRNPAAPFMTSTLQQEASRKLGLGARQAMSTAQRLYEAGHITYMRTDGIDMAPEAVHAARDAIARRYGQRYVPSSPRMYKNKAKNAQEAHECIRPTNMEQDAGVLHGVDADQRRLYDLIWKRTLASQMEAAKLERTTVEIGGGDGRVGLRATGQVMLFDGFLKVYEEGRDDTGGDEEERRLPQILQGEPAAFAAHPPGAESTAAEGTRRRAGAVLAQQHFTQPPPRYTEATLVKKMEELGIGRPSTYASIVTTIQDREYVRKDKNRLVPEDKGRLVTIFLLQYFRRYVGYEFTADMEEELDEISAGSRNWKEVLERFWRDFSAHIAETQGLRITEVLESIDEALAPHLYPPREDGRDPRVCPNCGQGRLHLRTARSGGAFIGCSAYPECRYTRPLWAAAGGEDDGIGPEGRLLGRDASGDPVWLRTGRFGPYVQRREVSTDEPKPPRASLPNGWAPDAMDLEKALMLLSLPRTIDAHPEDGVAVEAGIGRYGPYVRHGKQYASLKEVDEVFTVGMNRAMELLAQKAARGRGSATPLRELGEHPEQGGPMNVMDGRYGPYVKWGTVNATLPKGTEPADVTVEMARTLVDDKAAKKGPAKKKAAAKKSPTKKATTKKATTKKATARKTAAKKSTARKTTARKTAPAKKIAARKAG